MAFVVEKWDLHAASTGHLHPDGVGLETAPRIDNGVSWSGGRPQQLSHHGNASGSQCDLLGGHIETFGESGDQPPTKGIRVPVYLPGRRLDGLANTFRWLERGLGAGDLVGGDVGSLDRRLAGLIRRQGLDFRTQSRLTHSPRVEITVRYRMSRLVPGTLHP